MDFEKIKDFILEKKGLVIGIIATILIGGYFIQKNNQPAINNSQVLSENNKNQSTEFSKNKSNTTSTTGLNSPSKQNTVTVDIAGAVKHSGVYTLKNGARLNDLLKVCGGLTDKAETRAINRAALLKDQDQIYVPNIGEKIENIPAAGNTTPTNSSASDSASSNSEQVHLNSATVEDLQKLNGVGQKKAEQIIAYRDQNGGFKQIEDLTKVTGIGEKTFEKLKDQLAL
ncbi:helix-hairpin-helix domain-containing protein [uncultured Lactobacillus sp.]|uniref:helix-hairpin-helix domain-containing protein n=1 Tax=uncultured Lactobacillus sp. TaxID=153152 RepID=UPI0026364217|nr:helix-hairpin-helix domain-containing protein [uncultured Lactobacillus sp.]